MLTNLQSLVNREFDIKQGIRIKKEAILRKSTAVNLIQTLWFDKLTNQFRVTGELFSPEDFCSFLPNSAEPGRAA